MPLDVKNAPVVYVVLLEPPRAIVNVPVVPATIGRPVAFVNVAKDGVPRFGVVRTGLVLRTTLPVPVEIVTPVPPRATESVPVVPATIGKPVALVNVAKDGVPRFGVVRIGLVLRVTEPEPVEVVTLVPPRAIVNVPVVPATIGKPVALVNVANEGTPMFGVVRIGLVLRTTLPVPVELVTPVPPRATAKVPEVIAAAESAIAVLVTAVTLP